ncbi:hypothetical protein ACA910_002494 [Epithemia clementina (nom. ined.)]
MVVVQADVPPEEVPVFRFKDSTRAGGGTKYWITPDCTYHLSGPNVTAPDQFTSPSAWIHRTAIVVYKMHYKKSGCWVREQPGRILPHLDGMVELGGANVVGLCQWKFDRSDIAQSFVGFLVAYYTSAASFYCYNFPIRL